MKEKKMFYDEIKKYLDSGLMREIYSSNDLSICNIADTFYTVFVYSAATNTKDSLSGIRINKRFIKEIIESNENFFRDYLSLSKEQKESVLVRFDQSTLKPLISLKNKSIENGPSLNIDLELEEQIMAKNKSR